MKSEIMGNSPINGDSSIMMGYTTQCFFNVMWVCLKIGYSSQRVISIGHMMIHGDFHPIPQRPQVPLV